MWGRAASVTADAFGLVRDQGVPAVDDHLFTERARDRAGCRGKAHLDSLLSAYSLTPPEPKAIGVLAEVGADKYALERF